MIDRRRVRVGSAARDVTKLPDGAFEIDGTRWTAVSTAPNAWRVSSGERTGRVFVAGPSEAPWIFFDGRVYRPEVVAADRPARTRRDDLGALSAPMPATVRAVLVSKGDRVTVGQPLIVLEAMKMELPLRAPVEGTVRTVRCTPGDLVQPGTPLVEVS
jgi:biotin carboxyl carrier protein